MAVLKQAECHVTLANEGAFSLFFFFFFKPSSPSLALRAHECYVGTTSAHSASYSWPTCQCSCLLQRDLLAGVFFCLLAITMATPEKAVRMYGVLKC